MQDPLAEYHFNMTPYHYVENNPLRYIDPFGLDKEKRQKRRYMRKYGGDKYIPEVVCVGKKPKRRRKARSESGISITGDNVGDNGGNPNNKVWFEIPGSVFESLDLWLSMRKLNLKIKDNDLQPDKEDILEKSFEVSTELMKSDKAIIEETTENSPQADPKEQTIVKTYSNKRSKPDSVIITVSHKFYESAPGKIDSALVSDFKKVNQEGVMNGRYVSEKRMERYENGN